MRPGLHLAHKPVGPTSFSLVRAAMEAMRAPGVRPEKVAHGGTLDPFAHGLLVLLVGPATKVMDLLHPLPKTYVATVRWGAETDTCDHLGTVVSRGDAAALSEGALDAALAAHLGWQEQVPPATSAKKIGGEPAYRKAHRGEVVNLPPSRVYLHQARFVAHALPAESTLELTCRGGYYVRALARDLGRALGCGAHLGGLLRSGIGPFADPGPGHAVHLAGPGALPWCARRALTDDEVGRLRAGEEVAAGALAPGTWAPPAGFPDPAAPVLGVHLGRVAFLLEPAGEALRVRAWLHRGF